MTISLELLKLALDGEVDAQDAEMTDAERYKKIQAAVETLNDDRPDTYTEDVTGGDSRFYAMSSFTYWSEGFSRIVQVEYPAATVASNETPVYLLPSDFRDDYWAEISGTHTRHLFFPNHSPASTETMRVTYTVPYLWTGTGTATAVAAAGHGFVVDDFITGSGSSWSKTTDNTSTGALAQVSAVADEDNYSYKLLTTTIPSADFFAVVWLAASYTCRSLAAKYAKAGETMFSADSTTHTSRTAEFSARAEDYLKQYKRALGLDQESPNRPSGEFVRVNTGPGYGRNWLTRGRAQGGQGPYG